MEYYLVLKRNEILLHVIVWMNFDGNRKTIILYTCYTYTCYINYFKESNSWKQKVEW
jgi:hypothetical protein